MAARSVLITGSSTGIGAACVARQAAADWRVYAAVRRDDDGERLVAAHGGNVVPVLLDVTDQEAIDKAMALIEADVGQLDGVVNNAGVAVAGPMELLDADDWRSQFEVNFFGVVAVTKAALPLVDRAQGRFVHIGSISGRVGNAGMGPYASSKHALEGFNWALREELSRVGTMTSSLVEPGEIKTAIWDKARDQLRDVEDRLRAAGLLERYDWLVDGFHGFVAEGAEKGVDADRVAKAVEHALTSPRPKARYLVGPDARVMAAIVHLPDRAREFLFAQFGTRYEKMGAALRRSDDEVGAST